LASVDWLGTEHDCCQRKIESASLIVHKYAPQEIVLFHEPLLQQGCKSHVHSRVMNMAPCQNGTSLRRVLLTCCVRMKQESRPVAMKVSKCCRFESLVMATESMRPHCLRSALPHELGIALKPTTTPQALARLPSRVRLLACFETRLHGQSLLETAKPSTPLIVSPLLHSIRIC
jgi:hypothetical protein